MSMNVQLIPAWPDSEGDGRVRELFRVAYGAEPDGVWAAPGRVNLIGEHTDYNDGLCLPLALPHRTFVALRARPDRLTRLVSAQEAGADGRPAVREVHLDDVGPAGSAHAVAGWPAYVVGVAWSLEQDGLTVPGFDVAVDSCVPYGAGLSSSAALECAIGVSLSDVAGLDVAGEDRARLAGVCVRAENDVAGAPTGGMDQAASLRCRAGHALLLDTADGSVSHVPLDLAAAGLALLVVDTRAEHQLVDGQYAGRRAACEAAAAVLGVGSLREVADAVGSGRTTLGEVLGRLPDAEQRHRVRHVVTEIERVRRLADVLTHAPGASLVGEALAAAGTLLDESHASLRDDYEVSCAELDLAVETARAAGAYGARMTGGGFGGSAIALVDAARAGEVAAAVAAAFDDAGLTAPAFLLATASGPAERVGLWRDHTPRAGDAGGVHMDVQPRGYEKVEQLLRKGVSIPNPLTLDIAPDVDPDRISGDGVTIHPGCRIRGARTVLSAGVTLGAEGPVTIENCQLGPGVDLKGGYFSKSVFLEKANMGLGAHVREGTLLEEEANGAHCVGLKQTILFPFVTLGSLINFCDCLMGGGTSRKDHSEVGSSYIHFNFTPDGNKATASLFGDVPRGVLLSQPPIFLGGQGGTVGPVATGFGLVVGAGSVLRGDVLEDGMFVMTRATPGIQRPVAPRAYKGLSRVVARNIAYLANLVALETWYTSVRRPFFDAQDLGPLVHQGALDVLAVAKQERAKRLTAMVATVSPDDDARAELRERIGDVLAVFESPVIPDGSVFLSAFRASAGGAGYIPAIKGLPPEVSAAGVEWLQEIVAGLCRQAGSLVPAMKLFVTA